MYTQKGKIKVRFLEPKFDPKRKEKKKTNLYSTFFVWKISQWESHNNAMFRGEKASKTFFGSSRLTKIQQNVILCSEKTTPIFLMCYSPSKLISFEKPKNNTNSFQKEGKKKKTDLYSTFLGNNNLFFKTFIQCFFF